MASIAGKPARRPRLPVVPVTMAAEPVATTPAGDIEMDTTTTTATAEVKQGFAEAADRTQAGFAKGQAMFAEMGEFNKGTLDALVESSRIAARGFESLGQHAAAFVRGQVEDAQAQARTLAGVTSPAEFLKLQGDFARRSFDKMVAETSRGTEAMLKLAGEVAQPISNRVALAADRVKAAA